MTGSRPESETFRQTFDVSRETLSRFDLYRQMLEKWNKTINLVSGTTMADVWTRHFADSAQIWRLCPENAIKWVDLGSGGGFPGLVIAIVAAEKRPELSVTLVEADKRKAAFLRQITATLGLAVQVIASRIEDVPPLDTDVISARALAPLARLLDLSAPHLADGGICLFSKGESVESELTEARKYWKFTIEKSPSMTSSGGMILKIGDLARA